MFWFLFVAIGLAAAGRIPDKNELSNLIGDENIHLEFNARGQIDQEDIELNLDMNYVKIETDTMVFIHDYTWDQTLVKMNGRCSMVDQYEGIPPTLEDWEQVRRHIARGVQSLDDSQTFTQFRELDFLLNMTVLPEVMQGECAEINILILEETYQGDEADQKIQEAEQDPNKSVGSIYLPMFAPAPSGDEKSRQHKRVARSTRDSDDFDDPDRQGRVARSVEDLDESVSLETTTVQRVARSVEPLDVSETIETNDGVRMRRQVGSGSEEEYLFRFGYLVTSRAP